MTKYQFEVEEIKTCKGCPLFAHHTDSSWECEIECFFNDQLTSSPWSYSIPSEVGCPLVKVED